MGEVHSGAKRCLLFFLDMERGKLLLVESLLESEVRRHVYCTLQEGGAEGLRTDEHSVYQDLSGEG